VQSLENDDGAPFFSLRVSDGGKGVGQTAKMDAELETTLITAVCLPHPT
jgi:hypothetical protein